jgi:hypothetical protein
MQCTRALLLFLLSFQIGAASRLVSRALRRKIEEANVAAQLALVPCAPVDDLWGAKGMEGIHGANWMLEKTQFFPTTKHSWVSDKKSVTLSNRFRELNSMGPKDESCGKTPVRSQGWCPYGLGACFHLLANGVTGSFDQNATLRVEATNNELMGTSTSEFCGPNGNKKLSCFFQWPNRCDYQKTEGAPVAKKTKYKRYHVPELFRKNGFFWWTAQSMHFMWQLSSKMQQAVDVTKDEIGWKRPIIGMHVRRGDSCTAREECYSFKDYMVHAIEMYAQYEIRTIFLSTDSEEILKEAQISGPQHGFTIIHTNFDRKHISEAKNLDDCHMKGTCDVVEDMKSMIIDLELLAEADVFIGAFSSGAGRLAYELSMARKRCYPPFVSMDIPWCHNNGEAMGNKYLSAETAKWAETSC